MNEELIDNSLAETVDQDLSSGSAIIDSTQDAIVGAAQNVSQVIDVASKAALEHNISEVPFYYEVHFWIGLAFILSILLLMKPGVRYICQSLRNRIQKVVDDIDEAVKLRDDAQKLLAEYERKFVNVKNEVQTIVEQGQKSLRNFEKSETDKIRKEMAYKERETDRRIEVSKAKTLKEINSYIGSRSVYLAQRAINKYINETDKSKLIDAAIADLDKIIVRKKA